MVSLCWGAVVWTVTSPTGHLHRQMDTSVSSRTHRHLCVPLDRQTLVHTAGQTPTQPDTQLLHPQHRSTKNGHFLPQRSHWKISDFTPPQRGSSFPTSAPAAQVQHRALVPPPIRENSSTRSQKHPRPPRRASCLPSQGPQEPSDRGDNRADPGTCTESGLWQRSAASLRIRRILRDVGAGGTKAGVLRSARPPHRYRVHTPPSTLIIHPRPLLNTRILADPPAG